MSHPYYQNTNQQYSSLEAKIRKNNINNFSADYFIQIAITKSDEKEIKKTSFDDPIGFHLEIGDFKKNLDILLKKEKINYITEGNIISFKIKNIFCKISLTEDNQKFETFEKIPPKKYRCFIHKFLCVYWIDEEEEYNLLDSKTLHLLLSSLYEYKEWMFKDLTLDDMYFSKQYKCFFIKDFRNIAPLKKNYLPLLKYTPINILHYKDLFTLGENTVNFEEYLQLSSQKNILEVSK